MAVAQPAPAWTPTVADCWEAGAFGDRLTDQLAQQVINGLAHRVDHFLGEANDCPTDVRRAAVYLMTNSQSLDKLRYRSTAADILRLSGAAALLAPWRIVNTLIVRNHDA